MNYKQISNDEDNEEYIVSIHFAMKQEKKKKKFQTIQERKKERKKESKERKPSSLSEDLKKGTNSHKI